MQTRMLANDLKLRKMPQKYTWMKNSQVCMLPNEPNIRHCNPHTLRILQREKIHKAQAVNPFPSKEFPIDE